VSSSVRFGSYRFDLDSAQLWDETGEIHLTPKAAAVLALLVSRPGTVVTKEHLFETVWRDTNVGDDALTSCIQELRRALGDDPRQPQFIETRHRRGFRFIAPAHATASGHPEPTADLDPRQTATAVPQGIEPTAPAPISAIAVLPFADMSADGDQNYLCDGIAEELINALTHVERLRVVARTASFRFRSMGADVRAVGEQLGAGALLEGSVRKAGDRLRVTVQLVDAATGYHRWSRRFDRRLDDVFAIQDEIAESVVRSLSGEALSEREQTSIRRLPANTEAYEYYLRGRQTLFRQTRDDLTNSVRMFERAISLDEAYAPAHAGLAMAHAALYEWFGSADVDKAAAERASERGVALAANLADVHVARGCALGISRRYEEAATAFTAAIALNKNLFEAYYYYARSSFASGHIARSAELFQQASVVRREDFQSALLASQSLQMLGRDGEVLELRREGISRAKRALELNPNDARALSLLPGYLLDDGREEEALTAHQRALALYPDDMSTLINGACLRSRLGHTESALDLLERAVEQHGGQRDWIEHDSDYDPLRGEPRFQRLLAKLK
jgi:adenylate cyclase